MRLISVILIALAGTILGLGGAFCFNLAGLIWAGGSFKTALYWEPLESQIAVLFGCFSLLGWVISLVMIFLVSKIGVTPGVAVRTMRVGYTAAGISGFIVIVGLVFALVVLPSQYA